MCLIACGAAAGCAVDLEDFKAAEETTYATADMDPQAVPGLGPDGPDGGGGPPVANPVAPGPGMVPVGPQPTGPQPMGPQPGAQAEPCTQEASLRCAAAAGLREQCQGGFWRPADPCADGEICVPSTDAEAAGEAEGQPAVLCQRPADICVGNAGLSVCDGSGTMYACDERGVVAGMEACTGPKHCQAGLARGQCAVCVAGTTDEYACADVALQRCNADGSGYEPFKTCETAALCNTVAGDCTAAACTAGQLVCDGDVLQECNGDQTALVERDTCGPGLCDAQVGACDTCMPGVVTCEGGDTRVECASDGSQLQRTTCEADKPVCVGSGRCVACATKDDCGVPDVCNDFSCVLGICLPQALSTGTCPGGYCLAGACDQCRAPADCDVLGAADACQAWSCDSGQCAQVPDDTLSCRIGLSTGICSGGDCVACILDSDCTRTPGRCREFACTGGSCEEEITPGELCSTTGGGTLDGECSALGTCRKLCGNGQLDGAEECDEGSNNDDRGDCKSDCTINRAYTRCSSNADCKDSQLDCWNGVCTRNCETNVGCQRIADEVQAPVCYPRNPGSPGDTAGYCVTTCRNECPGGSCQGNCPGETQCDGVIELCL